MALVECVECKASISSEAIACPRCGKPRPPAIDAASEALSPPLTMQPISDKGVPSWLVISALTIIVVVGFILTTGSQNNNSVVEKAERTPEQKAKCEAAVREGIATNTSNYQDHRAYSKRLEEDCGLPPAQ